MKYLKLFLLLLTLVESTSIQKEEQQASLALSTHTKKDYSQYTLLRCNREMINLDKGLEDLWMKNDDYLEFMVHEKDLHFYEDCTKLANIQNIIDEEEHTMFTAEDEKERSTRDGAEIARSSNPFFKRYHNLEEVYQYMDELSYKYANLVKLENIGITYEGRDLKAMHISAHDPLDIDPNTPKKNKKTIVITSGLHAREWATITTTLWIATKLASKYGTYKKETRYLDNLDFFIIPVFNPDGYEYTWNDDRLWRKTRQQTYHPRCFGIDLDHSFDFHWQNNETPCSASYSGSSPFESLESKLLNDYLFNKKNNSPDFKLHGFLDFHSYGQEILYPYGFSCDLQPRDLENLLELSYGMSRSIRLKTGENYKVMASCKDKGSDLIPGFGSGNALDYMYHSKAYWAFQFKIRDLGEKGFVLPKKYIQPVGRENYAAVKHFCDFILNPEL